MNIVLSGPFGMGSLSDEIVLAGILKPLRAAKHAVTVLSANKVATEKMHGGVAVELPSPASLLSTPDAWKALAEAHLFVIGGAGVVSDKGKFPARVWLAQLEHVKQLKIPTAVIGAGAIFISDKKEQVRAQRLLHHFADGISVRDEASKEALIAMAISANRVSFIGDPTLSLHDAKRLQPPEASVKRVAFLFADGVPLRQTYAPEPTLAPAPLSTGLNTVLKEFAAQGIKAVIFHDDTRQNIKLARAIAEGAGADGVELKSARGPFEALRTAMSGCSAALTDTLHGLLFAAVHGVPVVYLHDSHASQTPVEKTGLAAGVLNANAGMFDAQQARELVLALLQQDAKRDERLKHTAILVRREAQNERMLERLVPKRLRYPKRKEDFIREEREKEAESRGGARKSPRWNRV